MTLKIDKFIINKSESNPITLNSGNNILEFEIEGNLEIENNVALEMRLYDKNGIPLLFYSPSHVNGKVDKFKAGKFKIKQKVNFPREINKGEFIANISLTDPGVESHVVFERALNLNITGCPTKTGHVFDYNNGAGFLIIS